MTWLLRGLALMFALGAIIAGLVGYRLSTQPAPAAAPAAPTLAAVHAQRPLAAGAAIQAEDLVLKPVPSRPAGGFSAPAQVVGQRPVADVAAGEVLTQAHLQSSTGSLQARLHGGERALAIKVDEVVGLGGFAQPGDLVDVLLYLRGTQETNNASSAQVLLSGVRLLAYGEALQPAGSDSDGAAGRAADKLAGRPRASTSAVVAVPESAASQLMLAANSGTLRLSLRPTDAPASPAAAPRHLVHLSALAQANSQPAPAAPKPASASRESAAILIHEGDAVRTIGAPR